MKNSKKANYGKFMEKYNLELNNKYGELQSKKVSPSWRFIYEQWIIDKIIKDFNLYLEDYSFRIPAALVSLYNYYCNSYEISNRYITLNFNENNNLEKGNRITKPLNEFCKIDLKNNLLFIKYDYSYDLNVFVLNFSDEQLKKLKMELIL